MVQLYTMMCGMNSCGKKGWIVCCLMIGLTTAEAQRSSGAVSETLYLPEAYDGGTEGLVCGGSLTATVAQVPGPLFWVNASRPFMIPGWNQLSASIASPIAGDGMMASIGFERFENFLNLDAQLVYGKRLSDSWSIGAGFGFSMQRVGANPLQTRAGYRFGALFHISEKIKTAFEVERSSMVLSVYHRPSLLPRSARMEWWVRISPAVQFLIQLRKQDYLSPSLAAVLKYVPHEKVVVRVAIDASTASYWLGIGLLLDRWRIELGSGFHPYLGATATAGLGGGLRADKTNEK